MTPRSGSAHGAAVFLGLLSAAKLAALADPDDAERLVLAAIDALPLSDVRACLMFICDARREREAWLLRSDVN